MTIKYEPPWWLRNGHLQSIYPSVFRKAQGSFFSRERITTPDDDFLDIDWARSGQERVVVITHGLEGHSRRPYVVGMAQEAIKNKWDVAAWNFRSCSGEPNNKLSSYHSGQTHDLALVIEQAVKRGYKQIALIGFSIGGNKTLLYLGREKEHHPEALIGAITFSVPLQLKSSSAQLAKTRNRIYMINFLNSFKEKFNQKNKLHNNAIDLSGYHKIKTFKEFDGRFTAPMNGFDSAEEYWAYSSSLQYLEAIDKPCLLINSKDDPFLTPECFPEHISRKHRYFELETTEYGGHVGFMHHGSNDSYWSEKRAFIYLNSLSKTESP